MGDYLEYDGELTTLYLDWVKVTEPTWHDVPDGAQVKQIGGRTRITRPKGQAIAASTAWMASSRWRLLFKGQWREHEHNNVLELRTVVQVCGISLETRTAGDGESW